MSWRNFHASPVCDSKHMKTMIRTLEKLGNFIAYWQGRYSAYSYNRAYARFEAWKRGHEHNKKAKP